MENKILLKSVYLQRFIMSLKDTWKVVEPSKFSTVYHF